MTSTKLPSPTTLEAVKIQFDNWRTTRVKRKKIPDDLWALAVPLIANHKYTHIATALRINHGQFKDQIKKFQTNHGDLPTFAECAVPVNAPEAQARTLDFFCKNGNPVKLSGITTADMLPILSLLVGK